ncbi:hypothetical protein [Nodularia sp. UHCC 0506]|uniref:hypothetical protein n=1 Tax=Nodularia sp. UHCC 0506 TaxID=3110243 RepID=UPI002B220CF5|nr:hypothetical protein [Nodularia sp. UHCC 0506]MEA5517021.1 hypothetical protein [Nodularia sp. UHCC 0506]
MGNSSSTNGFVKDLVGKLQTLLLEITSIILDAFFLALWVLVEWALNKYVIKALELSGISQWVLVTFQIVFSISTLVVVLSYVILDITTIVTKNWRKIKLEVFPNEDSNIAVVPQSQGETK